MGAEQRAFLEIAVFIGGALAMVIGGSAVSYWLQPATKEPPRRTPYESGEQAVGNAWGRFDARFYGMAIVFLLFEVETILLLPWATVWAHPALNEATDGLWIRYTALSGGLFIALLAAGLAYAWGQGQFEMPPPPTPKPYSAKVPMKYYEQINEHYAGVSAPKNILTKT